MSLALTVALVMLLALIAYVVSGGADFGGGIWELFARGPRAEQQKAALRDAIAPIWEANHVWLIIVVVLLFSCFPPAFSLIMTALHIPLSVMLVGIVLRGSAFTFRSYSAGVQRIERHSGRVFAIASAVSPFMLGVAAGAVASGKMRLVDGVAQTDFISEWLNPFALSIGLFTLCLCAYLAAVYMLVEVGQPALQDDFRRRALTSGVALGFCALLSAVLASQQAGSLGQRLLAASWALPFHMVTGAVSVAGLACVWWRRVRLARVLAVIQAALIILGWALAQYPYLVAPDLTISQAAAPPLVLNLALVVLALGSLLLVPAFIYLYRIFKLRPVAANDDPQS